MCGVRTYWNAARNSCRGGFKETDDPFGLLIGQTTCEKLIFNGVVVDLVVEVRDIAAKNAAGSSTLIRRTFPEIVPTDLVAIKTAL